MIALAVTLSAVHASWTGVVAFPRNEMSSTMSMDTAMSMDGAMSADCEEEAAGCQAKQPDCLALTQCAAKCFKVVRLEVPHVATVVPTRALYRRHGPEQIVSLALPPEPDPPRS
ncbi:hypothetical protein QNA08_00890 [Chelatococcus sp. SYSU_G07232]|uniref:WAP domain-containing protein n=2 Tax=Chelatococcus albus TaxID=3047466 RepID=A0ABT7ABR1_9HYPH|nr:hypothetical protein [Chelatococcus sp. SYSU_G07232]